MYLVFAVSGNSSVQASDLINQSVGSQKVGMQFQIRGACATTVDLPATTTTVTFVFQFQNFNTNTQAWEDYGSAVPSQVTPVGNPKSASTDTGWINFIPALTQQFRVRVTGNYIAGGNQTNFTAVVSGAITPDP